MVIGRHVRLWFMSVRRRPTIDEPPAVAHARCVRLLYNANQEMTGVAKTMTRAPSMGPDTQCSCVAVAVPDE